MMQARDVDKALVGFTKAVQFDPENGEAWNNIACLYVIFTSVILLFVHPKLILFLLLYQSLPPTMIQITIDLDMVEHKSINTTRPLGKLQLKHKHLWRALSAYGPLLRAVVLARP